MMKNNKKYTELKNTNCWVFDLDNTLYPASCNLFDQIDQKMGNFISEYFDIAYDEAKLVQKKYFKTYGTTLRGLMTEHGIEPEKFLSYVHDIDFGILTHDVQLSEALGKLSGRKVIYTNASTEYAERVLEKLGIGRFIDGIFGIEEADFLPKPHAASYEKMIQDLDVNPINAIMVEDMAKNLKPASMMGMKTVWIPTHSDWSEDERDDKYIDHVVPNLSNWLNEVSNS